MTDQTTTVVGGFQGDLKAEAFNPTAGSGCCGSPAADTGAGKAAATSGPCCGTTADAKAENVCCGSEAKAEAVASGAGCCR